jgi:hypothetical protein
VGENCKVKGCPEGQRCLSTRRGNEFHFECRRACNPFQSRSCPEGWVCGAGEGTDSVCYQSCSFAEDRKCPEGLICMTINEELSLLGCSP